MPPCYNYGMQHLEHDLQVAIVKRLRQLGFDVAADMNAAKRSITGAMRAKLAGMTAGEPDLRVYLAGGRIGLIEVKAWGGTLSPMQRIRHAKLTNLGYRVAIVKAKTPDEAADMAETIVMEWYRDSKHVLHT